MYFCTVNITNTTMKMDFPQVDLPTEVLAWTNVTEDILNIYKQSCRLQACIVAICTEGSMKASINLLDYEIRPNDLITLLPGKQKKYASALPVSPPIVPNESI